MPSNVIEKTFRDMRGQIVWGSHYSELVNLSFSMGLPQLRIDHGPYECKTKNASWSTKLRSQTRSVSVKGRWWLWVYCSSWKMFFKGELVATSWSTLQRKKVAGSLLEGQKFVDAEVNPVTGTTQFTFDLGGVLVVQPWKGKEDRKKAWELWSLRKPGGYYLSVFSDGTFNHRPGSGIDKRRGVEHQRILPVVSPTRNKKRVAR